VSTAAAPVPDIARGLVDDAAIFPPGNAPLDEAVTAHLERRTAPYADLVGTFVVDDRRLPDLRVVRDETQVLEGPEPAFRHVLPVSVVVTGGAGAIEPAVRWAQRQLGDRADGEQAGLRGIEVAIRESDAGDLAPNVRRIVAALDALGADLDDVEVYVETPRIRDQQPSPSWFGALDELAAAGHCLKLRTGGPDADAFPSALELATCIGAALDRELPFKCTAGLHNALRHRDDETGFEHHGFLNVLVATRASLDGADVTEVAGVLDEADADKLLARSDEPSMARARRWFRSFGSCSIDEPLADLRQLGLMPS
jgi:hypothetical protein